MCLDVHFKAISAEEGSMQTIGSTTELQDVWDEVQALAPVLPWETPL